MIEYKLVTPGAGKLLIAEPFMRDGNFKRSVVLISAYEDEGVVGFVLNRPTDFNMHDLMPEFSNDFGFDPHIFLGGPVQPDTLHFIHKLGSEIEGAVKIGEDIWWGGNAEQLSEKIKLNLVNEDEIRFFMGYSGWGIEQLDDEIEANTWIVANSFDDLVFDEEADNDFWRKAMQKLGNEYKEVSNYPEDLQWN